MNRKLILTTLLSLTVAIVTGQQVFERKQCTNGKYGFVDQNGREVIQCKYDNAGFFFDGLAVVRLGKKYGFIDQTGAEVIPLKYEMAYSFSQGRAEVKLNGKWGLIDKKGTVMVPIEHTEAGIEAKFKEYLANSFSYFAKKYVEERVNEWQKKGRHEPTTDWQKRVNETTRKQKIEEYTIEARQEFIANQSKKATLTFSFNPDDYDADRGVYLIKTKEFGNLLVPVPNAKASEFESSWNSIIKIPKYTIENDQLGLAEVTFNLPNGNTLYKYSNDVSLEYSIAKIDYVFDKIEIPLSDITTEPKGKQTISETTVRSGKSDVAVNIPTTNTKNDKTFAVIIANENYRRESQVDYAINDGETFKKYCINTLGIPEKNIDYTADATLNDIRAKINWLNNIAEAFQGEARIIFYYAGHGIPDEKSSAAYLLPVDGYGSDVTTGYKIDDLYSRLGKMPVKNVTIFMDACFSGAQRAGGMMASSRGVAIKAKESVPVGKTVVFSAAYGDETAFPYHEKGHGMFTYFLLKKLQESKGNITFGELGDYITSNVRQQSVIVNRKSQTPTVIPSNELSENWRVLRFVE